MQKQAYRERTYRKRLAPPGLITFQVAVRETDLYIAADEDLSEFVRHSIHQYRNQLEAYIRLHPEFLSSLIPLREDAFAPEIVKKMLSVSSTAGVGPMAAVAGAMAEFVGRDLQDRSLQVIVENGGDIYLNCKRDLHVGIFAGKSPLSNKLTIRIDPQQMPLGICTSSGTVGPSLSFGKADAVCVISKSTALADAAASQIGNQVKSKKDIQRALDIGSDIPGVSGVLVILDDRMGAWGEIELV